jgi:tetratricopeptide (TPR) repeat protein
MRVARKKTWLVIGLLSLAAGVGTYYLVRHLRYLAQYQAAEEALARRDFRQAAAHLRVCLDARPGDLSARLLAAQAARRQGDLAQAAEHLSAYEAANGPADELAEERRRLRAQEGDPAAAELLLASGSRDPPPPGADLALEAAIEGILAAMEAAFERGMLYTDARAAREVARLRDAVALWQRRREAEPDQVQADVWRGRIHLLTNEPAAAAALLRQALVRAPDHFGARLSLAGALVNASPAEAADHLQALRRQAPGNGRVGYLLAAVRRSLGQHAEARRVLDEMLAGNPDDALALTERARVDLDAGRPAEAEPFFRRAEARAPNDPDLCLALSRCLYMLGRGAEAKEYQTKYEALEAERTRAREESLRLAKSAQDRPGP